METVNRVLLSVGLLLKGMNDFISRGHHLMRFCEKDSFAHKFSSLSKMEKKLLACFTFSQMFQGALSVQY